MTATNEAPQQATLKPQQIQAAAQSGLQLIREGCLTLPSDMAMNGTLAAINAIFSSLATGSAILVSPDVIDRLQKNQKAEPKPRKKPAAKKKVAKKTPAKKKTTKR